VSKLVTAALVFLAACSTAAGVGPQSSADTTGQLVTVTRVVDGDTFIAKPAGRATFRVRLIGVDTPETVKPRTPVQCFGPESSAYAKRVLTGRKVRLVYDVDRYDRYGRTLAYVYVGTDFFNLDLVRRGYAVLLTIPPDVAHADEFVAAQAAARAADRGLWHACEPL
jgi:micrococcal nuclease